MVMKLQHFSHDHELMLINEVHKDDEEIKSCYGCGKPMLEESSAFRCTYDGCKFGLHKRCAEQPKEIKHPLHSDHHLTLHAHPPYLSWDCICNACTLPWKRFTYNCQLCEFDICISCILEEDERVIEHEGHNHPLTLLKSSASFHCDACDTRDEDLSYLCTTCLFWIHKTCAFSPNTIHKTWIHDHPLNLAYSLPYQFRSFTYDCDICRQKVHPSDWVYCCSDCRYFAHVKCATTSDDQKPSIGSESEIKDVDHNLMLHFPMPESEDPISQLVKVIGVQDAEKLPELRHFSHDHTLVLIGNNDDQMMNNDEIIICDGCVRPITTLLPFYGCGQCNFFLHTSCANLPPQLLHSYHPHPLELYKSPDFFSSYQCDRCLISCNGFAFRCRFCKDFYLCIQCSFLPSKITHDSHSHPLQLQNEIPNLTSAVVGCRACRSNIFDDNYGCEPCRFYLHPQCAINWPSTVTHEWDQHPIALLYPPFNHHPDEFYCEICEEEMHPKYWLYHCRECDQPFHKECIHPTDYYSNVKFGGTLEIQKHPHELIFVRKSKNKSPSLCDRCGQQQNDWPVLECAPCNFLLCILCTLTIAKYSRAEKHVLGAPSIS